ncbi:HEAT repeat domain-containing protein [Halobellus ordinarius]|uniref:HEAT repeat domain-containing protein n=1 Tax=Halobellus ordinarius TaxID=3075120 RepID=UPI0028805B30|nr:hypothetical protein [Halobellus sp. ZY16]
MDTSDAYQIGKTVAVDGAHVTVAAPEAGLFSSKRVNPPRLGERKVEGYTGVGVKHLVVVLRNTAESAMSLPDPADLDLPSLYDRQDAIEHHYTHRGETRTSLLRLFEERDRLNEGETVRGLLTHTYAFGLFSGDDTAPVASPYPETTEAEAPDPLELTVTPPDAEESTTLRWDPSRHAESPRVSMTPASPGADEGESTDSTSDRSESFPRFCSECHADLDRYENPKYCPQCGSKVATEEMALRGAKWWGAVVSRPEQSFQFDRDHPLSAAEFEELVALLEVANDDVRTYAAHALAEYPFSGWQGEPDQLGSAIDALPTLIERIHTQPWACEAELSAVLTVVETAFNGPERPDGADLVTDVMELFDGASEEAEGDEFIPDEYGRREEHGFLRILEELSAVAPERVRPALPEVIAALERELDREDVPAESTECEMCGKRHELDRVTVVEPVAEFLTAYVEEEPEAVSPAIPPLIEVLDPDEAPTDSGVIGCDCDRTVSELLLTLSEHSPDDVAAGREAYLRVARNGGLPIRPTSTKIGSFYPRVRETVAELLATLVSRGAMEPAPITEGLRSENGPYLETMAKAAAELSGSDPELLSSSISDLIALLDFERFHYTIVGAAATALGHLDAPEAVEPLCDLYAEADEGELGAGRYVRDRVASALHRIEAAPIRSDPRFDSREDPVCASCGKDLDDYGLPEWCPGCGKKIY